MKWLIAITIVCVVIAFVAKTAITKYRTRAYEKKLKASGIHDIDRMDDYELRTFIKLMFAEVGFTSTDVSEEEKLFGADLLLDGDTKVAVRVMRMGHGTKVGIATVQAIHAARTFFETDEAWLITNTICTSNAKQLSDLCNVKLIDRELLQQLVVTVNPDANPKEVRESIRLLFEENARRRGERLSIGHW